MHGGQLATARTESLEGRMQQRNASPACLPSLPATTGFTYLLPLLVITCDRIFGTTCAIFWTIKDKCKLKIKLNQKKLRSARQMQTTFQDTTVLHQLK
jgi:hypothetical protein